MRGNLPVRRVQFAGGGTAVLSLPRPWVKLHKIGPGASLRVEERTDGTLAVIPPDNPGDARGSVTVDVGGEEGNRLFRRLLGAYLAGATNIKAVAAGAFTRAQQDTFRTFVRSVVGTEIMEETSSHCLLQDLSHPLPLSPEVVLKRAARIVRAMHADALAAFRKLDGAGARAAAARDVEVDRLTWLIERQFNLLLRSGATPEGIKPVRALNLLLVAKNVERIADHAERMALAVKPLGRHPPPAAVLDAVGEAWTGALALYDGAVLAMEGADSEAANRVVDGRREVAEKSTHLTRMFSRLPARTVVPLAVLNESGRRTGFYAADIAEHVINDCMGEMLE